MSSIPSLQDRIAPGQLYSCNACGKGCKMPWKIRVEQNKVASIQAMDVHRKLLKQGYTPLRVLGEESEVGRKTDGSCVFLRSNNLCEIHAEHGFEAKPSVCQLYPFSTINSPDGHYFSLSFSCPAVLASTGRPAEEHLPDVVRSLEASPAESSPMSADIRVPLTEDRTITWTEYLSLEKTLLSCIGAENPIKDLLVTAASLAWESPQEGEFCWGQTRPPAELLQDTAQNFPLFSVHTIALLEGIETEKTDELRGLKLLQEPAYESRLVGGVLPTFEVQPACPVTTEAVGRYLRNLIVGKQLIFGAPLVARLLMLATSLSILFYYLEMKRALRGGQETDFEDLAWAFDLIEVNLVTHNETLNPLFLDYQRLVLEEIEKS